MEMQAATAPTDAHEQRAGWAADLDRRVIEALGPTRETELEISWNPRGRIRESTQILALEQLAVWVATLAPGEWAVIALPVENEGRWAQVMRLDDDCIVEVHDGTVQDWASRVLRDEPRPEGAASSSEWGPQASAAIIWAWMHGGLPEGCHRTRLVRRRAGTAGDTTWCTADVP
ncbi:MAG: hypothetical protein WC580_02980 [Agrococcus sp.]